MLEKLLKGLKNSIKPIILHLNVIGPSPGSRPAKAALAKIAARKALAAAAAKRTALAKKRSLAAGTPIGGSRSAAAQQALRRGA